MINRVKFDCENHDFKEEIFYVTERIDMREFRNVFINEIIGDLE